ncbi:hypothetical protein [Paenibacillus oryzisoli]|uniref:Uncharacterized protein n=1 Tax=Paenibacillus oryzisoli TaxID=1850517 RepID=A0A197ZXN1_9BACL|nr:hypothetical protein [Paenibacillus oryzisoli]OAS13740.1 hypothetical protein A8708_25195 [Paenibacillus oryzisoli]
MIFKDSWDVINTLLDIGVERRQIPIYENAVMYEDGDFIKRYYGNESNLINSILHLAGFPPIGDEYYLLLPNFINEDGDIKSDNFSKYMNYMENFLN